MLVNSVYQIRKTSLNSQVHMTSLACKFATGQSNSATLLICFVFYSKKWNIYQCL